MTARTNRQVLLASRPEGMVEPSNFELRSSPVPEPAEGEFLVRNLYASIDPAMRGWMTDAPSYIPPVGIGEVMRAACTAQVVESRHPDFEPGDIVVGAFGWQDYAISNGSGAMPVTKVPEGVPPTWPVGVLGLTSLTAYFGLEEIGRPEPGDTVVVSGAAGATGSVVGQIAKIRGCRAVGIAGGPAKCEWLTDELSFDAAIDYRGEDVSRRLREICPDGINVFWDNVGGPILEAGLSNLARGARVVLCGAVSTYNDARPSGPANYMNLLVRRARMEGFVVFDYLSRTEEAMAELVPWIAEGRIHHREDIREGLETAPEVLRGLFAGDNTGKLLLKIAEEGV
ncbi:MAG TPA: NADP-dependent oxidoreductase [Solirubrobacteraceae bacterium]|nr:NADP-dependent oxidoreductase [Solirubrobacteraceae bacterium]